MSDPVAGLRVAIDTTWAGAAGYRPVGVTVTPLRPSPAERVLRFELFIRRNNVRDYDLSVTQDVVLPAGASRPVEATIAVPQHIAWWNYRVEVREDGRELPRLGVGWTPCYVSSAAEWSECFPAMLVVGDTLPDIQAICQLFPEGANYQRPYQSSSVSSNHLPTVTARPSSELPERWIDYSGLDVVYITLDDLAKLEQRRPRALRAILEWTAAGGNLWIFGAGDDWKRLGEIEQLVGLLDEGAESGSAVTEERRFLPRPLQMGMVVAFRRENELTVREWESVSSEVGRDRWLWCQRHGLSTSRENGDYWNFLIPGVGLAPATEFCVLITLFVLAIGPLNYWLLRRWGRIHLLVVTIPVGAATVTLLLFVYAVLADGLGTRVRVRSVTRIDQRVDRAVCWSRASYYAGLAPYGGLAFPQDVAVTPLEDFPANADRYPQSGLRQEMRWDDAQRLRSGFLASRTPTQYFTVRSRESRRGLVLARPRGKPQVINQLGTPIHQVLMCDEDGQLYWAEGVPADGAAELSQITLSAARANLRRVHQAHEPQLPEGMRGYYRGGMFGFSRRRYWRRWGGGSALVPPSQTTSLLEQELRVLGGAPRQGEPDPLARPRSYVAVVEQSPEVALGVSSADEEESYHVVFGRW